MQKYNPVPPILIVIISMMTLVCATSLLVGGLARIAMVPVAIIWLICLALCVSIWLPVAEVAKSTTNLADIFASRFDGLLRKARSVTQLLIGAQLLSAVFAIGLGAYAVLVTKNMLAGGVGIAGGVAGLLLGLALARKPLRVISRIGKLVYPTPAGYELSADLNPVLWDALFSLSENLGTPCVNRVVVGAEPGVYVVNLTLYLSLATLRVMSADELGALIAHEFAHLREENDLALAARTHAIRVHRAASRLLLSEGGGPVVALLAAVIRAFQPAAEIASRERELAADRVACTIVASETLAVALTRELVVPLWWNRAQETADDAGPGFATFAHKVEAVARLRGETLPDIGALNQRRATHPVDEHPTHIVRMTALQASAKLALLEALVVPNPEDAAIALIDDQEAIEMQFTQTRPIPVDAAHEKHVASAPVAEIPEPDAQAFAENIAADDMAYDEAPAQLAGDQRAPTTRTLVIPASRPARMRMALIAGGVSGLLGLFALMIIGGLLRDLIFGFRPSGAFIMLLIGLLVAGLSALAALVCRRYMRLMSANKPALRVTSKGIRAFSEFSNGDLLRWSELSDISLGDVEMAGMAQTLFFIPHNKAAVLSRFSPIQKLGIRMFGAALQAPHYISSGHVSIPMGEVYKLVANYYKLNIAAPGEAFAHAGTARRA